MISVTYRGANYICNITRWLIVDKVFTMFLCVFQGLTIADLEDLLEDIKVYLEMEQGKNADYWRDIIIVAEDEIGKLKKIDPTSRGKLMHCCASHNMLL